jgi:vancomycin resistance protein YoaR
MQASLRVGRAPIRLRRTPVDFGIIFTLVILCAVVAAVVGWQIWHANRIFGGVTVANVPVGGLSRSVAFERVSESLALYPLPTISITHNGRQWPITGEDVRVSTDLLSAVNRAYLVGRSGGLSDNLSEQVAAALGATDIAPEVSLETSQLRYTIDQIAAEIREPARPATQMGDVVVPAKAGVDIDVEATLAALTGALEDRTPGQPVMVPLTTVELAPPAPATTGANGQPVPSVDAAEPVIGPVVLRDALSGISFALDPATLKAMSLAGDPTSVDETKLRALLDGWAAQIDVTPRNARLRFDQATQSPVVVQESRAGRKLDVDATLATIKWALASGGTSADLTITTVLPQVDSNRVAEMGIRELVAAGTSYFAGSSAERMHNIDVAAVKFDGVVIPPDGIFSFNEYVEDVSAANGFEDSLIIWGDRTAVGIGGGVCQVSTTIFRSAYEAGLPIVERYNHGYVVSWYGEPGLDATIFTPSVDFRFRNDTGAYLLMEPVMNAAEGVLTINLYGTKPDRQVIIGEPVKTDIKPAPPDLYTVDESLAPGERKQVDWAAQGMTVEVTRTIIEGGQTRTDTLVSKYEPWRAIYLVGSPADIPASAQTADADSVSVESDSAVTTTEEATIDAPAVDAPEIDATAPVTGPDQ